LTGIKLRISKTRTFTTIRRQLFVFTVADFLRKTDCTEDCKILFVEHFRYLGHLIDSCLSDDKDIQREIKALFTRTNMLCRRFKICSLQVKLKLFRSYLACLNLINGDGDIVYMFV